MIALVLLCSSSLTRLAIAIGEHSEFVPVAGGSYVEGVVGQPIAVNPAISSNQADLDLSALLFTDFGNLITRSELSPDNRTYTITLKEDLVWDDGKPLTSDDVIYTIQTIQNPDARSPLAKDWQGVVAERVSQIQAKFSLPTPYVYFKDNVSRLRIIPKHIFGAVPPSNFRLSAYILEPVGNGPYRFKEFSKRRDGFITGYHLVPNEHFIGDRAFIADFYVQFYENSDDLIKDFELRRVNGFGNILPPPQELVNSKNAVVEKIPMPLEYAVFANPIANSILKDKDLRYALAAAIDKQAIVNKVFGGEALVTQNPLPFDVAERPSHILYNLEEAKKRIAALKTKPDELTLLVPHIPFVEAVGNMIKEMWTAAGIPKVSVVSLEADDFVNNVVKTRNYDLALFGMIFENPNDLFPFWHSSQRFYPGLNFALYQNAKVDVLIESARQSRNIEEQRTDTGSAEDLILADNPAIPLFSLPYFYAHTERLYNFKESMLLIPSDRFNHVNEWSVIKARVLK